MLQIIMTIIKYSPQVFRHQRSAYCCITSNKLIIWPHNSFKREGKAFQIESNCCYNHTQIICQEIHDFACV